MPHYELVVIGSGPAGEKAAAKAAYFKKSVALIEKKNVYGGAGLHTGTIPSKVLQQSTLMLPSSMQNASPSVKESMQCATSLEDFMYLKNKVIAQENQDILDNLRCHGIDIYNGTGSFIDAHTINISSSSGDEQITADYVLVATGSYPHHPDHIPFDWSRIHDSDSILLIDKVPKSLCVVGGGVIGCEYATIFASLGCKVYLINNRNDILSFLDSVILDQLIDSMHQKGIETLFGHDIEKVTAPESPQGPVVTVLDSGDQIESDLLLYAAGRQGNAIALKLGNAGVELGDRERVPVNEHLQTNIPHIYAAGDIIGFPALASTSMDQGRSAVSHMFQLDDFDTSKKLPFGIYTIPEVSTVGLTEQEAIKQEINYEVGYCRYDAISRGKIMGEQGGLLKLVFDKETLVVLGVHIMGRIATELIHYGMRLVEDEETLSEVITTVFNYPTLHDLYKYAAYDGLGNIKGHKMRDVGLIN